MASHLFLPAPAWPMRPVVRRRVAGVACLVAACSGIGPAFAQSVAREPWRALEAVQRAETARRWPLAPGGLSIVDLGAAGPNQRSRHALRMRFDGATRAMRSLGVEAEACSSLLRSSTRMQAQRPGGPERVRVSVSFAIDCRFF